MTINCVWEHNGRDTLLYAVDFVGAYTRGETLEAAVRKMQAEICSYLKWCGKKAVTSMDIVIIEEKVSELAICDADSDVLFESEKAPLTAEEYIKLKALALKSAQDFLALYDSVPDKNATAAPERKTFYGQVPRTANEMYEHIVHRIFEGFVILPDFHAVYHFHQRIHVAFFLRPLKDDVGHKGAVQEGFCFGPELVALLAVAFGVGDQSSNEFQNIAFRLDIGQRIIVHGF